MASRERTQQLIDAGIAVAVLVGSLVLLAVGNNAENDSVDLDAVSLLAAAGASLPLVARRRAPLTVFVVVGLASAVLRLVADPAGPPLGPTLALYWMVALPDESRPSTRVMAPVVAAVLVAHVAAGGLARSAFPWTESLFGILVWGGAWLVGERTRTRHERLAELEERALRAEREAERERRLAAAEERTRIARDLHDSAGHAINVILVHAGLGRLSAESDPAAARRAFETIEEVARETVSEIDQMVRALREDHDGVEPPAGVAALQGLIQRHRAAGLEVAATVQGDVRALPPAVDRAAYRIVQEALTNAARHGAGSAELEVAFSPRALELTVANLVDSAVAPRNGHGHGVIGMRERASLLGGRLEAGLRDGRFLVHAHLPLAGGRT
jgi:signal transduction histidine kinase